MKGWKGDTEGTAEDLVRENDGAGSGRRREEQSCREAPRVTMGKPRPSPGLRLLSAGLSIQAPRSHPGK